MRTSLRTEASDMLPQLLVQSGSGSTSLSLREPCWQGHLRAT